MFHRFERRVFPRQVLPERLRPRPASHRYVAIQITPRADSVRYVKLDETMLDALATSQRLGLDRRAGLSLVLGTLLP